MFLSFLNEREGEPGSKAMLWLVENMGCVVPAEACLDVCVIMVEMSVLGGNWRRFEEAVPSAGSLGEEQDSFLSSFLH